jgi:cell wall-associated NlpC family hydrolase
LASVPCFLIPTSVSAAADPPLTVAEAKALTAQLQTDAAAIDQQYAGVREQIKQGRSQLRLKQADVKVQTDKVARMRLQVGQVALAQFQNRSLDTAAQLIVTSDAEGFLSQISTVQKVSENQNSVLQDYQQAQANWLPWSILRRQISRPSLRRRSSSGRSRKLRIRTARDAKNVLAKLDATQRQRLADEENRATARANAAASRDAVRGPINGSAKGSRALAFAKAQLGEPYARNAAGPSSWDCSGLTMKAWGSVGVSLPHSRDSSSIGAGRSPESDLQLGDLVFSTAASAMWASMPQWPSHPRATAWQVGGVHQDLLHAVRGKHGGPAEFRVVPAAADNAPHTLPSVSASRKQYVRCAGFSQQSR